MKGTFPEIVGKHGAHKRSILQVDGHTARTPAGSPLCSEPGTELEYRRQSRAEHARGASSMRSTSQRMIGSALSFKLLTALLNPQFKYQNDHVEFQGVFHLWPSPDLNCLTPLGCYAGTHRASEVVSGLGVSI